MTVRLCQTERAMVAKQNARIIQTAPGETLISRFHKDSHNTYVHTHTPTARESERETCLYSAGRAFIIAVCNRIEHEVNWKYTQPMNAYSFIRHIICACVNYTRAVHVCTTWCEECGLIASLCGRTIMAPKRLPSGRSQVREILESNIMARWLPLNVGVTVFSGRVDILRVNARNITIYFKALVDENDSKWCAYIKFCFFN